MSNTFWLFFVLIQVPGCRDKWQLVTGTYDSPVEDMHIVYTGNYAACTSIVTAQCHLKNKSAQVDVRKYGNYSQKHIKCFGPE